MERRGMGDRCAVSTHAPRLKPKQICRLETGSIGVLRRAAQKRRPLCCGVEKWLDRFVRVGSAGLCD